MKVALFKSMEYGAEITGDESTEKYCRNYVRTSEYIDVEFPPLQDEAVVRQQIEKLDEIADKITDEWRNKIAEIQERKSKLLAITHQPA